MNFDRFREIPTQKSEYSGEEEAERRERHLEADVSKLRRWLGHSNWIGTMTLFDLHLNTRTEELVRLQYLEPAQNGRWGEGYRATPRLLNG